MSPTPIPEDAAVVLVDDDPDQGDERIGVFELTDARVDAVRLIGKGATTPEALRTAAQRIEDGDDELEGLEEA